MIGLLLRLWCSDLWAMCFEQIMDYKARLRHYVFAFVVGFLVLPVALIEAVLVGIQTFLMNYLEE